MNGLGNGDPTAGHSIMSVKAASFQQYQHQQRIISI
jgi:hypothetical protein